MMLVVLPPEEFAQLESTIALWLYQAWQLHLIPAAAVLGAVHIVQQLLLVDREQ